jgi:error-prone DNA polymerase
MVPGAVAPALPAMNEVDQLAADIWATGVSTDNHPLAPLREWLDGRGVLPAASLGEAAGAGKVLVAGIVTHRQRPSTAGGTVFINLEDETGVVNVICSPGLWAHHRPAVASAAALVVRGRLEGAGAAPSVVAERLEVLELATAVGRSRDFR